MNPNYPVYIISKGRWKLRPTSRLFESIGVPYSIVVEPQEYEEYAKVIDPKKILTLPFSNLGQGSIPARNWVWDHSISKGATKHWIFDDNIYDLARYNRNRIISCVDGTVLNAMEVFSDRYENLAICGPNYSYFCFACSNKPPINFNKRVYSSLLIRNDIPFRWRGRYNEDTDLCLRVLKAKWCTVLFNAFLIDKAQTMTCAGGNTEDLYKIAEGRLKMAQSLQNQHPDVTTIVRKWGRWQHHVNYKPFANNKLQRKEGLQLPKGVDNFGLLFQEKVNGKWVTKSEITGE